MNTLTYKEAYNLVIEAYFKDEIQPFNPNFCFCGTLSPDENWSDQFSAKKYPYCISEYSKMEEALFSTFPNVGWVTTCMIFCDAKQVKADPLFEEHLFNGMCEALEVLKNIHRERGEDVDNEVEFKKRELKLV